MPTKKLRVSFDIDVEVLASALAVGHHAMRIETYTEEPTAAQVVTSPALALPKPRGGKPGIQRVILDALRAKSKVSIAEMTVLIITLGYSKKSLPNQLYGLLQSKLVRRVGVGLYAITKKGANS